MSWKVLLHPRFKPEFERLTDRVQDELLSKLTALREIGPTLGRPDVDTLKNSRYPNMKELRFRADGGVWRVALVFDPRRDAVLLVAGDKSGGSEQTFYRRMIAKADMRYREHLENMPRRPEHDV